jgi:hypothetical protein
MSPFKGAATLSRMTFSITTDILGLIEYSNILNGKSRHNILGIVTICLLVAFSINDT